MSLETAQPTPRWRARSGAMTASVAALSNRRPLGYPCGRRGSARRAHEAVVVLEAFGYIVLLAWIAALLLALTFTIEE
jgi:hypothetical protein